MQVSNTKGGERETQVYASCASGMFAKASIYADGWCRKLSMFIGRSYINKSINILRRNSKVFVGPFFRESPPFLLWLLNRLSRFHFSLYQNIPESILQKIAFWFE